jgi:AcrR family transcriptional regulator
MSEPAHALSRVEAQARTREAVLGAAEELFLSVGFEGTTVARIAERAGRTQGAIYSNFSGKDDLGFAVLQRRFLSEATRLSECVAGPQSLDERIDAVGRWWSEVAGQQDLFVLVAEYGLASRRAGKNTSSVGAYVELVEKFLLSQVGPQFDAGLDDGTGHDVGASHASTAIVAIVAMATGLAVCQLFGALDQTLSSQILADTVRRYVITA